MLLCVQHRPQAHPLPPNTPKYRMVLDHKAEKKQGETFLDVLFLFPKGEKWQVLFLKIQKYSIFLNLAKFLLWPLFLKR